MKRISLWISAGLIIAATAGAVAAADMASVIHARQAHYKEIGKATKGLSEALNSPSPQLPAIQAYARQIDQLAPQIPSWFPAGSGPEAGVKTGAKPDIWAKSAEFKAAAAAFTTEAHRLDQVAAAGDLNAVRAEFPALGKACKTCHESFRQKD
ncbi:MAG: cytochrome c [Caulobacteraceae bacterium]|nr:cytochrome c [Caulobacteraceae bacterium]